MGPKKKKTEKQKDFVKPKLKVGKSKAKPDNYTDTSFTARSIALPTQSIRKKAESADGGDIDLEHYLSLTRHHSSSTRKEVLNYIEKHLPSNPRGLKEVVTRTIPLITDQASEVATALVSLLTACGKKQPGLLELHIRPITLFILLAMTHLQPSVRNNSTKYLAILIEQVPEALLTSSFSKIMKAYFSLLSWSLRNDSKSKSVALTSSASLSTVSKKARASHLNVLRNFLSASLIQDETIDDGNMSSERYVTHPLSAKYLFPSTPQPYLHYKLFVQEIKKLNPFSLLEDNAGNDSTLTLLDLDSLSSEDLDTRQKIMIDIFLNPLQKNLKDIVKEAGDAGREANLCLQVLQDFSNKQNQSS